MEAQGVATSSNFISQSFGPSQVEVHTQIAADVRRVFHALTLAEYLEAWMCFPDSNQWDSVEVTQAARDFIIKLSPLHRADLGVRITGAYLICEPSKIVFSWAKQNGRRPSETTVCIRLVGLQETTSVRLNHIGFVDNKERIWHEAMWQTSFKKLNQLLY